MNRYMRRYQSKPFVRLQRKIHDRNIEKVLEMEVSSKLSSSERYERALLKSACKGQ